MARVRGVPPQKRAAGEAGKGHEQACTKEDAAQSTADLGGVQENATSALGQPENARRARFSDQKWSGTPSNTVNSDKNDLIKHGHV